MESSTSLLSVLQRDIPLSEEPFAWVARETGLTEDEVLKQIRELKERKIIRQISPVYDAKKAGYDGALVAFELPPDRLEQAAEVINPYPGVSHNYERTGKFNLWFTLAVPPDAPYSLEQLVASFAERTGARRYGIFRTLTTFKIGVRLDFTDPLEREEPPEPRREGPSGVPLTDEEKLVIRLTQEDLPLERRPFKKVAEVMGTDEGRVVKLLQGLKEKGVMRRFAAILYHRRAGFKANAMVVWRVEPGRLNEAGKLLASFKAVSHCYERNTADGWPYNLYSMVHGRSKEDVERLVSFAAEHIKPMAYELLYSKREFKKKRVRLFDRAFYEWEL
ncbi:MAG: Lrp/AsnC family transcriptional regulator [Aquificae bacterium]|nr:Lrp/AsnC family transcriptional regulator [Aquificota bacterium]